MERDEEVAIVLGLTLGLVGVVLLALAMSAHERRAQGPRVIKVTPDQVSSPLRKPPNPGEF